MKTQEQSRIRRYSFLSFKLLGGRGLRLASSLMKLVLPTFYILFATGQTSQAESSASESENVQLRCMANGYDVVLINDGPETIAAGTMVSWAVPITRVGNSYTLTKALEPSGSRFLTAALGSNYVNTQAACEVKILSTP